MWSYKIGKVISFKHRHYRDIKTVLAVYYARQYYRQNAANYLIQLDSAIWRRAKHF